MSKPHFLKKKKKLNLISYQLNVDNNDFSTHSESLVALEKMGFQPDPKKEYCPSIEQVTDFVQRWQKLRASYDYNIDGIVVKVNEIDFQKKLGIGSRYPKWATAYKFSSDRSPTKLLDIQLRVGRSGRVTPVAMLEPTLIMGSTVSQATLHNFEYMMTELNQIKAGCQVYIEKGGDVIPKVVGVVTQDTQESQKPKIQKKTKKRSGMLISHQDKLAFLKDSFPSLIKNNTVVCPCSKQSPLVMREGKVDYYCQAPDCPEQQLQQISYFASKNCMNIGGFAENTIKELIQNNLIATVTDIFDLKSKRKEILQLEGWGETKLDKLLTAIEKSKRNNSLENLLTGLSIPQVGTKAAKQIAEHSQSFGSFTQIDRSTEIPKLSSAIGKSVADYVSKNQTFLKNLLETLKDAPCLNQNERQNQKI